MRRQSSEEIEGKSRPPDSRHKEGVKGPQSQCLFRGRLLDHLHKSVRRVTVTAQEWSEGNASNASHPDSDESMQKKGQHRRWHKNLWIPTERESEKSTLQER